MTTAKTRAQMQLDANQGHARRAKAEHALALQERADDIARLRTLRLTENASANQRTGNANGTRTSSDGNKTPG